MRFNQIVLFMASLMLPTALVASPLDGAAEKKSQEVVVGAERTDQYYPLLKGKRVAVLSNHTGMVGDRHVVDMMRRVFRSVRCTTAVRSARATRI